MANRLDTIVCRLLERQMRARTLILTIAARKHTDYDGHYITITYITIVCGCIYRCEIGRSSLESGSQAMELNQHIDAVAMADVSK